MMNMRLARPKALVDLGRISDLVGVESNGGITLRAMTTQAAILRDARIADELPLIQAALRLVGHSANRSRGTFGGSIANADPAAELPAVMLALDATMVALGPQGERITEADDFFDTYYTTDLGFDEILTEVRVPVQADAAWGFQEVARRHGDYAAAGVAMTARVADDGTVADARIALFSAADRPLRARQAEQRLVGSRLGDEQVAGEASQLALEGVDFSSDVHVSEAYRRDATAALVRRAVLQAATSRKA